MSSRKMVIYHGNCWDGLAAAWVLFENGWRDAEFIEAQHGDAPPDVAGKDVIIVDFSYPRHVLVQLHQAASSLVVLDHHQTARDALAGVPGCTFDMTRSGAMLAWDFARPGEIAPALVRYVQDRDLWRHELRYTHEVNAWLQSFPKELSTAVHLAVILEERPVVVHAAGDCLVRQRAASVNAACARAVLLELQGVPALVANADPALASDVGNQLIMDDRAQVAGSWCLGTDGTVRWSVRSVDAKHPASEIALAFGGGGHRNAAGFAVGWEEHTRLLMSARWGAHV